MIVTLKQLLGRPLSEFERRRAPKRLYVEGSMPLPIRDMKVSVVGTRSPTEDGMVLCQEIVRGLVKSGVVVVSGLARGIDTVAHRTAIEEGGKTIAVLPTPLNICYPPENSELLSLIKKEHLVVSQFMIGEPVRRENFLKRNKLMALISNVTVIVEAGERSGTFVQAKECLKLGRPLFGHISLMRWEWFRDMVERGAIVFENADDFLEKILPKKYNIKLTSGSENDMRWLGW